MSLPETCPFCGSGVDLRNAEKWVGFTCMTTIHQGHDARRMQSITCAGLERTRLLARVAELEEREKQACDDEAWAHQMHVGCIAREDDGWVASAWNVKMQSIDQANAATIHEAIRALREKMEAKP